MTSQRVNGNAVRDLRRAIGLSGAELCRRVEAKLGRPLSAPHLTNIEKGDKQPSPDLARAIAEVLGVTLATIADPTPIARVVVIEVDRSAA
jgi:transcriptional regulator with XRE-family HTH domain